MLYIVCALHCEARPLIDYYKLSAEADSIFPIFSRNEMKLIIAGVGKISVAAAMAYLYAKNGERKNIAWLNVGIAGHKNFPIGTLLNINKVTDERSSLNWYPSRLSRDIENRSCACITVDFSVDDYKTLNVYDMEASAFSATALRFSSNELIQLLKVVSDNEDNHIDNINKSMVKELLADNMVTIDGVVKALLQQSEQFDAIYSTDEIYTLCIEKWHFSQYQKKALQRLIQRWRTLMPEPEFEMLASCQSSRTVIVLLEHELENFVAEFSL